MKNVQSITINNILNSDVNFVDDVEAMVKSGAGYFEAILHWCERRGIDQDQVIPLIKSNPSFKSKLMQEAVMRNCLKKKKIKAKKK